MSKEFFLLSFYSSGVIILPLLVQTSPTS